jgi:DMSO/TMAO reductase YedYZ molybdopterin-dependent catalytic subunit
MEDVQMRTRLVLVSVLILLSALAFFTGCTSSGGTPVPDEFADWNLTINGSVEKVLTLNEIKALPAVTGHGFSVSTVGIKYGPYFCRGVDLRDLAGVAGGIQPGDEVWIYAPDGYLWVFDYDQLQGQGFVTFNASLREIPSPPLRVILMYELDGRSLTYDDGGPCRIAIISDQEGIVTEGSAWVKWVSRIEVHRK